MSKQSKSRRQARFRGGDQVRVARGVRDPDYPDIPMGGWIGHVKEVDSDSRQCFYLIAWTRETLAAIDTVFRKRCERDGLEYEETWLTEDDIEAHDGGALLVEQPTHINTRPLSPEDQDDRIKSILGATGDDPVPDVDEDTLLAYWRQLNETLTFPFEAEYCPEDGPSNTVNIIGLTDPEEYDCDEFYGLFCEARLGRRCIVVPLSEIEVKKGKPNHQMTDDYSYWFCNWR